MKKISSFSKICLGTLCLILGTLYSQAATYTWDGSSSTAWNLAANWDLNAVPTATDNVKIVTTSNQPQLSTDVTVTNFTLTSGTLNLNGYNITVNGNSTFTAGTLSGGSTDTLYLTAGTATFTGGTINPYVHAVVATLKFNGSTINGKGYFEANTNVPGLSNGGCIFNDTITIVRSYATSGNMHIAYYTAGNTYNKPVKFINNGTGSMNITTIGASKFNDNIIVECTNSGGINFGSSSSSDTLASGKTITVGSGGFITGSFVLRNFIQLGSTAQSITVTSAAIINCISAVFNGNVTFTAPAVLMKSTTCNGTFAATQNGASNVSWSGYNTFNSTASITNSSTSAYLRLDLDSANTFIGNLTAANSSSGEIKFCHSATTTSLFGNLTATGSNIAYYSGSGTLAFRGGNVQSFNSPGAIFKNVLLNKSANYVMLDSAAAVTGTFTFTKGVMRTTSSDLLTFNNTSNVSGASDSSFISGPVKKIGNSAFIFPTGKGVQFKGIEISAPSVNTDAYTAEYFDGVHGYSITSRQSSIKYLDNNNYWSISRTNGTSNVYITLHWSNTAQVVDKNRVIIIKWNGSQWVDEGATTLTGNNVVGSAKTSNTQSSFGTYSIGYSSVAFLSCGAMGNNGYPDLYYNFNGGSPTTPSTGSLQGNIMSYGSGISFPAVGISGNSMQSSGIGGSSCAITPATIDGVSQYFAIEMYVKFDKNFLSNATSSMFFRIRGSGAPMGHNAYIDKDKIVFDTYYQEISAPANVTGNSLAIQLDGINQKSLDYYLDGNWHHFGFTHKLVSGNFITEIWVDGILYPEFKNSSLQDGRELRNVSSTFDIDFVSGTAYEAFKGDLDEISINLTNEICPSNIEDHGTSQASYVFTPNTATYSPPIKTIKGNYDPDDFPLNYAPGTNNYEKVTPVLDQLTHYPIPRYKPLASADIFHRNINWMASDYVGGKLQTNVPVNTTDIAVDFQKELHQHWNYYFNVSENTSANNIYEDEYRAFALANGTNYKYSLLTYRGQMTFGGSAITPVSYDGLAWIKSQQIKLSALWTGTLPENNDFYLYDSGNSNSYKYTGETSSGRFWNYSPDDIDGMSPDHTMPANSEGYSSRHQLYAVDGLLQNELIADKLSTAGNVPIEIVVENNEITSKAVFDLNTTLAGTPLLTGFTQSGKPNDELGWMEYLGEQKEQLDNEYRDNFICASCALPANTPFLNYAVDGNDYFGSGVDFFSLSRDFYPNLRTTQTEFDYTGGPSNVRLPTPDLYPRRPSTWLRESENGADHGFKWLTRGRIKELSFGDNLFAPFVAPGWADNEEENMRPGQWLGLLKCVNLLGVDFYQTGHFKDKDQYTATILPPDPAGYVWQASTPAYAQAIASRSREFYLDGVILDGDIHQYPPLPGMGKMFAFQAGSPNNLVVARKINGQEKFLISGSVQKISNVSGNSAREEIASISLPVTGGGYDNLKFNIRSQGSTYIYDKTVSPFLFYQIDAWHEHKHPERWSKDFKFQAEVYDNTGALSNTVIYTDPISTPPDYTNFTSYVTVSNSGGGTDDALEYQFRPRISQNTTYYVWIRARNKATNPTSSLTIDYDDGTGAINIHTLSCIANNAAGWVWYHYQSSSLEPISFDLTTEDDYTLLITPDGDFDIDQVILSVDKNLDLSPGDKCSGIATTCITTTTISSGNGNTSASWFNSNTMNDVVYIQDDFTIDAGFSAGAFSDKTFIITNGKKIIIDDNVSLIVTNCKFSTCGSSDLWDGFKLGDVSALDISGSVIEDALIGIEANLNSNLLVDNNIFDHNNVSIAIDNLCSGSLTQSSLITRNLFTCRDRNVKSIGQKSSFHIALTLIDGSTVIGHPTTPSLGNVFENAYCNIFGQSVSDVVISNNTFRKAIYDPYTSYSGSGISLITSCPCCHSLRDIHGTSDVVSYNFFDSLRTGFYSDGTSTTLEHNVFANNTNSILFEQVENANSGANVINVSDNLIGETESGISINTCINSEITIANNVVQVSKPADIQYYPSGIDINSVASSTNVVTIANNTLLCKGTHGIYLVNEDNSPGPVIQDNTITLDHPYPFANDLSEIVMDGISLESCSNAIVECNKVTGNGQDQMASKTAMKFYLSDNNTVTCNKTDLTESGMNFIQSCVSSKIAGNSFNLHKYGLVTGIDDLTLSDGEISDQTGIGGFTPANEYTGDGAGDFTALGGAALFRFNSPNTNPSTTIEYEDPSILPPPPQYEPLTSSNNGGSNQSFQKAAVPDNINSCANGCGSQLRVYHPSEPNQTGTSNNQVNAQEKIAFMPLAPNMQNNNTSVYAKLSLYSYLAANEASLQSNSLLNEFSKQTAISNIGILHLVNEEKRSVLKQKGVLSSDKKHKLDLSKLMGLNSLLDEKEPYSKNEKLFNLLFISYLKNDSLSQSQILALFDLASQCSYTCGKGVISARSLYRLFNPRYYWSDNKLCGKSNDELAPKDDNADISEKVDGHNVWVYPNPASSVLNIICNGEVKNSYIRIYDMIGREALSFKLNSEQNKTEVNIEQLTPGSYFYSVYNGSQHIKHDKLIVIR